VEKFSEVGLGLALFNYEVTMPDVKPMGINEVHKTFVHFETFVFRVAFEDIVEQAVVNDTHVGHLQLRKEDIVLLRTQRNVVRVYGHLMFRNCETRLGLELVKEGTETLNTTQELALMFEELLRSTRGIHLSRKRQMSILLQMYSN
jgi:hypothetical protein